jgi:hypothetical protein
LTHLVRLRLAIVTLQIDFLCDSLLPEYMVAASYTFHKSQVSKQTTQLIKADIRIGPALENFL